MQVNKSDQIWTTVPAPLAGDKPDISERCQTIKRALPQRNSDSFVRGYFCFGEVIGSRYMNAPSLPIHVVDLRPCLVLSASATFEFCEDLYHNHLTLFPRFRTTVTVVTAHPNLYTQSPEYGPLQPMLDTLRPSPERCVVFLQTILVSSLDGKINRWNGFSPSGRARSGLGATLEGFADFHFLS